MSCQMLSKYIFICTSSPAKVVTICPHVCDILLNELVMTNWHHQDTVTKTTFTGILYVYGFSFSTIDLSFLKLGNF